MNPGSDVHPVGGYVPVDQGTGFVSGPNVLTPLGHLASTGTDTFTLIFIIVLGGLSLCAGIGVLLWARRR